MNSENRLRGDVLVIDDNASFVHALRAVVNRRVFSVDNLRDGMKAIRGHCWSRIVLDLDLPDSPLDHTVAVFASIKLAAGATPIVILTGFPEAAGGLMDAGAACVIGKGDGDFADKLISAL